MATDHRRLPTIRLAQQIDEIATWHGRWSFHCQTPPVINRANRTQSIPRSLIASVLPRATWAFAVRPVRVLKGGGGHVRQERTDALARSPVIDLSVDQRPLHRGRTWARTLTLIALTAILALGGLGTRSIAASGRSLALGSGRSGSLTGVSAESAIDAWAVGYYGNPTTFATESLTLHWDGTKWSKVSSPNPGGTTSSSHFNFLAGVSATSATDAWAVGGYTNPTTGAIETLVLRWNGTKWSKVASPNPGGTSANDSSSLAGVSADLASDAWAVGAISPTTSAEETIVLHWNGTSWSTA